MNRSSGSSISITASLVPNSSAFDVWIPSPRLSHTSSTSRHILEIISSLFSSLPPSWTITVHLRNPVRSAVQWCPIANRFRTTPTTTTSPLYPSCLLSNLAPLYSLWLLHSSTFSSVLSTPSCVLSSLARRPCVRSKKETFQIWPCLAEGSSTCWDRPSHPLPPRLPIRPFGHAAKV